MKKRLLMMICAGVLALSACGETNIPTEETEVIESVEETESVPAEITEDVSQNMKSAMIASMKEVFNVENYNLDSSLKIVNRYVYAPSYSESDESLTMTYSPLATTKGLFHSEYNKETGLIWDSGTYKYSYDGEEGDYKLEYYSMPNFDGTHALIYLVQDKEMDVEYWKRDNDYGMFIPEEKKTSLVEMLSTDMFEYGTNADGYVVIQKVAYKDIISLYRTYFRDHLDYFIFRDKLGEGFATVQFNKECQVTSVSFVLDERITTDTGTVESIEITITPSENIQITEIPRDVLVNVL